MSDPEIDMIQRRGFEHDDGFTRRSYFWIRRVFVAQLVDAAVTVNANGFQSIFLEASIVFVSKIEEACQNGK